MNHAGKDAFNNMVWDVHAERLVSCGDCHYSRGRPERLAGTATPASVVPSQGVRRRCESCHSLKDTHSWLPNAERHFNAVACESCHVPKLEMGAQQTIDSTIMLPDGAPVISYRGIETENLKDPSRTYIRGYQPLLRIGKNAQGRNQVFPYNLVSHWFWTDGDSHEPIAAAQLRQAWLQDGGYAAEILEGFDANRDGSLDAGELRIDNNEKLILVKERLRAAGVRNPLVRGEVRAYHIHHNIRHGRQVNRDCSGCHPENQDQVAGFELAPYVPGNVKPVLMHDTTEINLDGIWKTLEDGRLMFVPEQGVAQSWQALEKTIRSEP
jgi:hypothetical protein